MNAMVEFLQQLVAWALAEPTHEPDLSTAWSDPGVRVSAGPMFNLAGEPGSASVFIGRLSVYRSADES